CGKTTVHDVLKRYDKTGSAIAKKRSGRKPIFGALELDELKRMVIQDTKHYHLSAQEIKDL
ncbi:6228_t:CDS:1, partial [Cetraspora pellucida]